MKWSKWYQISSVWNDSQRIKKLSARSIAWYPQISNIFKICFYLKKLFSYSPNLFLDLWNFCISKIWFHILWFIYTKIWSEQNDMKLAPFETTFIPLKSSWRDLSHGTLRFQILISPKFVFASPKFDVIYYSSSILNFEVIKVIWN